MTTGLKDWYCCTTCMRVKKGEPASLTLTKRPICHQCFERFKKITDQSEKARLSRSRAGGKRYAAGGTTFDYINKLKPKE